MAAYALPQRSRIDDLLLSSKRVSYTRRKLLEDYQTKIQTMESVDILHSDEDDVLEKVAQVLTDNTNIRAKKLYLMRGLTVEGARILGEALPRNQTITVLKLVQNSETPESLPVLLGFLQKNTHVTDLLLSDCPFPEDEDDDSAAQALARVFLAGTIQRFSITNVPSFGRWVSLVAQKALANPNCRLQQAKMIRCGIDAYGTQRLAHAIDHHHNPHTQLKLLNLEGNPLGDDGAIALARALRSNPTLEKLTLGRNCEIGDEGAKALAGMLAYNNRLREVYLAGNHSIRIAGKEALVEGCRRNTSLVNTGLRVTHRHPLRPTVLEQLTDSLAVNSARQTWNNNDGCHWSSGLLSKYLARVSAKPAVLFLALQENGDLFFPYIADKPSH